MPSTSKLDHDWLLNFQKAECLLTSTLNFQIFYSKVFKYRVNRFSLQLMFTLKTIQSFASLQMPSQMFNIFAHLKTQSVLNLLLLVFQCWVDRQLLDQLLEVKNSWNELIISLGYQVEHNEYFVQLETMFSSIQKVTYLELREVNKMEKISINVSLQVIIMHYLVHPDCC